MTDFIQQDLSGSRFDQVLLTGADFYKVRLDDAHFRDVDLRGLEGGVVDVLHGGQIEHHVVAGPTPQQAENDDHAGCVRLP